MKNRKELLHILRGKKVYLCLSENDNIIHLLNPYTYKWICDSTKDKRYCKDIDSLLIRDFLNFFIQKAELLKERGDLHKVWDLISSLRESEFSFSELFSEDIIEYYLEEYGEEREVHLCEKCLGIFIGNLFKLLEE